MPCGGFSVWSGLAPIWKVMESHGKTVAFNGMFRLTTWTTHMLHAAGIISYMLPTMDQFFVGKCSIHGAYGLYMRLPGHQQNKRTPLSILVREVERGLYRPGRWIPCTYLVIVKRLKNGPPYDSKRTRSYNDNLYLRNNQPSTSYLWWLKLFHNAWLYHSISI